MRSFSGSAALQSDSLPGLRLLLPLSLKWLNHSVNEGSRNINRQASIFFFIWANRGTRPKLNSEPLLEASGLFSLQLEALSLES